MKETARPELFGHALQPGRFGYVVVHCKLPDHYALIRECPECHKKAQVIVPAQGLWDWEHGEFVQVAMPNLSAEDRETVITGYHSWCWNRAMGEGS